MLAEKILQNVPFLLEFFNVQVDQTFLKVSAKNLVKVAGTGEVISRKSPPILKSFPSSSAIKKLLTKYVVIIMRIINLD